MTRRRPTSVVPAVVALAIVLAVAGCGAASEIQSIPPGSQIVDVRTPREFADWHFPGAVNIPVQELPKRILELDRRRQIIVYCRSGHRASTAKRILLESGFTDVKNGGGLSDMRRFAESATARR